MNNERGFTLIELIVAMALTAVIGALLLSLIRTATVQAKKVQERSAIEQSLHSTLEQIRSDIQSLHWTSRDPRTGLVGTTRTINGQRLDSLQYSTVRIPWDGSNTWHARPFSVQLEPMNGQLHRTTRELADGKPPVRQMTPEPAVPYLIECKIQYHTGEQWQDQWSTQSQQRLPVAIAIRLTAGPQHGPFYSLSTVLVPTRVLTATTTG